ncbi:MAG: right-handed parallel beta-helix repeat-containing protein [Brumimicrobium sp.]|nr:right-handed parallel beta-helix repeat-containing protein [Brumimicrobium sp.]
MKKVLLIGILLVLTLGIQLFTGCKKKELFSKNTLSFSTDTLVFDTIFTTVGSTTKRIKIYNKSNQSVKIQKVTLMGGKSSPFRINLDGVPGVTFTDIVIPQKDSLFMFVEVTLGENSGTTPMIIEDQIEFLTNGKTQHVQLAAWGQDAYFHYKDTNEGIWPNDKPHVIYDYAAVDSAKTLTIQAGTKIYLHKNALLFNYKGTLKIQGTYDNKVIIQGDRLEPFYQDVKGQYYGIYMDHARTSEIDNCIIKNGTAGIHVYGDDPSNSDYTLKVTNTEIFNSASYGIFNYSGGRIYGENLNIHDNDVYAYFVLEGGDCNFRQSQFLSWGSDGSKPAIAIKNYFTRNDGITYVGSIYENSFYNSIIYGGGEYQIAFDTINTNGVTILYEFDNNLIKQKDGVNNSKFIDNTWNKDPKFKSIEGQKYIIKSASPCIDAGKSGYATPKDIEGTDRDMGQPDIGAYEVSQ